MKLTDQEWRAKLDDMQYHVLRQNGTERPFTGQYYENEAEGTYSCAGCGTDLFDSSHKFHSGCGWPSYWGELETAKITQKVDYSHGMIRTELRCSVCDGHLGHIFDDGPSSKGGMRYCINSAALLFRARE